MSDMGLYDSDTGESLEPVKTVDVTKHQDRDPATFLVFTKAKRGRIMQLHSGCSRIHYFIDEERGRLMMDEDAERFGFRPGVLRKLAFKYAP